MPGDQLQPPAIDVVEVTPGQFQRSPFPTFPTLRPRWTLAIGLFFLTLFSTTTLGPFWSLASRTDVVTTLYPFTGPRNIVAVWSDPFLLGIGLSFSLPILFILLCHELGHYLACQYYRVRATLPYFVPAPIALGTFGAFIKIRSPIRTKRQLFDIGIAGPIAGFVALLPFLIYGIARSEPSAIALSDPGDTSSLLLLVPGQSLAMTLATRFFHGPLGPDLVLDLHPFALAAWVGLLATALNLLPLGQLDGGHILYAVAGRRQRLLVLPLWTALVIAGLQWRGWLLWAIIVVILGLRHPPVWDEEEPLDAKRKALAVLALAMFVLAFMPVPLTEIAVQ